MDQKVQKQAPHSQPMTWDFVGWEDCFLADVSAVISHILLIQS